MNYILGSIPFFEIFEYLVVGLLIFLAVNFVGRYIVPLIEKRTGPLNRSWQKIKIIVWLVYFGLFFASLLRLYTAITLIFTIVVLGLGWEYWKNMFSGVLIKFTGQINEQDFISTDFVQGTIKTIHLARSELINEKGELVIIPNSRLRNSVVTHLHKIHDVNICVFEVKNSGGLTTNDIHSLAYNCPYISSNQAISVEKRQDQYVVKATIIDNSFTENAINYFNVAVRSN